MFHYKQSSAMLLKSLGVILFIMPFFRGLYFLHTQYILGAFFCVLLLIIAARNKYIMVPESLNFYLIVGVFLLYLIRVPFAVDSGMATFGVLKWGIYVIFMILLSQLDTSEIRVLRRVVGVSGVALAIITLIACLTPQGYSFLIQNKRLGSFFQYANSFGIYMLVALLLYYEEYLNAGKWDSYILPMFIFTCVRLTYSRSLSIITVVLVIILLASNKKYRIKILCHFVCGNFIGFLIGSLIGIEASSARVEGISFGVSEWQSRLAYYTDAMKIILNNPMGLGYLGYKYIQKGYQSAYYYVKFVHSSVIQFGLDTGILGMVAFIITCLKSIYDKFTQKDIYGFLGLGLIIGHSLIDIDFEFSAIVLLWILLIHDETSVHRKTRSLFLKFLTTIASLGYIYFAIVTGLFYNDNYKKAIDFYPLYTDAKYKLITEEKSDEDTTVKLLQDILAQNQWHHKSFKYASVYWENKGDYKLSLYYIKGAMRCNPLEIKYVEDYSRISLEAAKQAINTQDNKLAKDYLEPIIEIEELIQQRKMRISDRAYNLKHIPVMVLTKNIIDDRNEAISIYESIL